MRKIFILLVALAAIMSCAKTEFDAQKSEQIQDAQTVTVMVMPFEGDDTKSTISKAGDFAWASGDKFGVYPVSTKLGAEQTSQQVMFQVQESYVGSKKGLFTGTGWGLVTGGSYDYFAYYPYDKDAEYDNVNVTYPTTYTIADSTSHIKEDYLVAPVVTPVEPTDASFVFYHMGALVNFKLLIPAEDRKPSLAFDYMEITCADKVFATAGYYNPNEMTVSSGEPAVATYPDFYATSSTDTIKINLNDIKPDANGYLNIFLMLPPTDFTGKTLNVTLDGNNYKYYNCARLMSGAVQSGKTYSPVFTMVGYDAPVIDLNESGKTANCYVVNKPGRVYRFNCKVRGNGVDPISTDTEGPEITGYASAQVTWETINTNSAPAPETIIVANPTVDTDNGFIYFETPDTFTEGNALISVKDASENILWSWHIWATRADLDALAQTYGGADMMDRNLGALSATPGNGFTLGFHYQWGRPFPITGGSAVASDSTFNLTRMATTGENDLWVEEETNATRGTLTYSAQNPTHFIYANDDNKCIHKGNETISGHWLWINGSTSADLPSLWDTNKTMYDPCPIGWKVPSNPTTATGVFAIFDTTNFTWNSSNKGRIFESAYAYYPAAGFRGAYLTAKGGNINGFQNGGYYWSSSKNNYMGVDMDFSASAVNRINAYKYAFGFSVRPCKE